jgi:hypothetical protein
LLLVVGGFWLGRGEAYSPAGMASLTGKESIGKNQKFITQMLLYCPKKKGEAFGDMSYLFFPKIFCPNASPLQVCHFYWKNPVIF